jgi:hypothetical protein
MREEDARMEKETPRACGHGGPMKGCEVCQLFDALEALEKRWSSFIRSGEMTRQDAAEDIRPGKRPKTISRLRAWLGSFWPG